MKPKKIVTILLIVILLLMAIILYDDHEMGKEDYSIIKSTIVR